MRDDSVSERPTAAELDLEVEWSKLIDDLLALRGLEADWDGQGAEAIDAALVDGAIGLARRLREEKQTPADRVTAGVNGTIFFGWHFPGGYREIEVISPKQAEVRIVSDGSEVAEESFLSW